MMHLTAEICINLVFDPFINSLRKPVRDEEILFGSKVIDPLTGETYIFLENGEIYVEDADGEFVEAIEMTDRQLEALERLVAKSIGDAFPFEKFEEDYED
jgi:hypothetical protein